MPAWITSLLRELVWVPIASSVSRITTSRPSSARRRAIANPTTPAPITIQSTRSTSAPSFGCGDGAQKSEQEPGGGGAGFEEHDRLDKLYLKSRRSNWNRSGRSAAILG